MAQKRGNLTRYMKEAADRYLRAVNYLRVSTTEQRQRQTIQQQRDEMDRFCHLGEVTFLDTYEDDGVSGALPMEERPDGRRLMEDARQKKFDIVYVTKLDRLARDSRLILNLVHDLKQLGIRIQDTGRSIDQDDAGGMAQVGFFAVVAGWERARIAERTSEGKWTAMEEGRACGRVAPYGYRIEGAKSTRRYVLSTDLLPGFSWSEVDIIHQIYDRVTQDRGTTVSVSRWLNTMGVPTRSRLDGRRSGHGLDPELARWTPSVIRGILINPLYKGVHVANRHSAMNRERRRLKEAEELIEREYDRNLAIISEEQWAWVQQRLQENKRFSRHRRNEYLLSGLVRCAHCGGNYYGRPNIKTPERSYPKYECGRKTRPDLQVQGSEAVKCPQSQSILVRVLDEAVWQRVLHVLAHPNETVAQIHAERTAQVQQVSEDQNERSALQARLKELDEEDDRIILLFKKGHIREAKADAEMEKTDTERRALTNDLARLEGRKSALDQWEQEVTQIEEVIQKSYAHVQESLTFAQRQEVVRDIVQEVILTTEEDEQGRRSVHAKARFKFVLPAREGREDVVALKSESKNEPLLATLVQALALPM